MGCFVSKPAPVAPAEPASAKDLLQSLKSKKSAAEEKVDDKSSSESEKRAASIETFTWEVYTYADREEAFKSIMSYSKSRQAFHNFALSKSRPPTLALDNAGKDEDSMHSSIWDRAHELFGVPDEYLYDPAASHTGVFVFDVLKIERLDVQSLPLVSRAKPNTVWKSEDDKLQVPLQSLYLFFKSPMYLTWRAEESAHVGEITATNLSVKGFSFRESAKIRSASRADTCNLAEMAFCVIDPNMIDHITNCSSWLGIFIAAAEGLPFALFVALADTDHSGYEIVYLNRKSSSLFKCPRSDVIKFKCKIPFIPEFHGRQEAPSGEVNKGRITVKMSAVLEDNHHFSNYACLKPVFDQQNICRFVVGVHGDSDKLQSRRDVKMLEVLLGILPDDITDEN